MHNKVQANPVLHTPTERFTISQLDVARVVALIGIFSHHLWKTVIVDPQGPLQGALDILFSVASDGVILFNIISGFLLAMPYLGPEHRSFTGYRVFLQKRTLRIIPPYYLALFLFTWANILCFDFPLSAALYRWLQHLLFINSLDYSNMFLNFSHFWYLGLLVQFYLLFPIVLRIFVRVGAAGATLSILVLCWGSWIILAWYFPTTDATYPGMVENLMHFNLPGRLPEFAIGMWLASLWSPHARPRGRSVLARPFARLTVALVFSLILGTPFLARLNLPLIHIHHVALSLALFLILLVWPPMARAGESAFLKTVAEQSYAIYIVHHPLFSYLGVMPSRVTHSLETFMALMAVLLPLSYWSARLLNLLSTGIVKGCFGAKKRGDKSRGLSQR